jgi:uncharacterized protein YdbL (DUF1318 family)
MILLASAARASSGNSGAITLASRLGRSLKAAAFQLNVTAAATDVGDTLDVYIQHSTDGGSTFDDFIHFTQVLGNGGAKRFIAHWVGLLTPTTALHAPNDAALAAGVSQGPIGDTLRVKWVVVDADADASFTFGVTVSPVS